MGILGGISGGGNQQCAGGAVTNIVSLVNAPEPDPDPDIIAGIERMLAQAKAGDLLGFAYASVTTAGHETGWVGIHGTRNSIAASIMMLHHRYAARLMDW